MRGGEKKKVNLDHVLSKTIVDASKFAKKAEAMTRRFCMLCTGQYALPTLKQSKNTKNTTQCEAYLNDIR